MRRSDDFLGEKHIIVILFDTVIQYDTLEAWNNSFCKLGNHRNLHFPQHVSCPNADALCAKDDLVATGPELIQAFGLVPKLFGLSDGGIHVLSRSLMISKQWTDLLFGGWSLFWSISFFEPFFFDLSSFIYLQIFTVIIYQTWKLNYCNIYIAKDLCCQSIGLFNWMWCSAVSGCFNGPISSDQAIQNGPKKTMGYDRRENVGTRSRTSISIANIIKYHQLSNIHIISPFFVDLLYGFSPQPRREDAIAKMGAPESP